MLSLVLAFTRDVLWLTQNTRNARIFDYAFGFVLLWDPKGSVVATDANTPRRRYALAGLRGGALITRRGRGLTRKSFSRRVISHGWARMDTDKRIAPLAFASGVGS